MKVSLNQANKLRNKLEGTSFKPEDFFEITTDVQSPVQMYDDNKKEFERRFEAFQDSFKYVQVLRDLINKANIELGVNEVIAEIALLNRLISGLRNFVEDDDRRIAYGRVQKVTFDRFQAQLDYKKRQEEKDPTHVAEPQRMYVTVLDEDRKEQIRQNIKELVLEKEASETKRNELNHANTVELPADLVKFLRDNSLVK